MAARTIDGPTSNYLTIEEVSGELGMSAKQVQGFIDRGIFPKPIQNGSGKASSKWSWRQVLYCQLYLEMRPLLDGGGQQKSDDEQTS